jgi:hypothetical protein
MSFEAALVLGLALLLALLDDPLLVELSLLDPALFVEPAFLIILEWVSSMLDLESDSEVMLMIK